MSTLLLPEQGVRRHVAYVCKEQACYPCQFCDGGLYWCTVCNGFEGTLTTDCCGRRLTEDEERRIYDEGTLDFRDGKWVPAPNFPRSRDRVFAPETSTQTNPHP